MEMYPTYVKNVLLKKIKEMASSPALFCHNPETDFTRNRKLSFEQMLTLITVMEGGSLKKELLDYFHYDVNTVTSSAFIQQRSKIKPEAFEHLFHEFNTAFPMEKLYHGFRLLACDGSNFITASNPADKDNHYGYLEGIRKYNMTHLNALYDLCSRRYVDATIQPGFQPDERGALITMLNRYRCNNPSIIIADRGYTSYNLLAYAHQHGLYYVIRYKECHINSLLSDCSLPSDCDFDYTIDLTLCNSQRKELMAKTGHKYLEKKKFSYFNENGIYQMNLRTLRIKLADNNYEYIITNLSQDQFDANAIKELYNLRWGIETSFRELKYAIGTTHFHSKKDAHIKQEIFAKIILYNFCEIITTHVLIQAKATKHTYQFNYTMGIHICVYFLKSGDDKSPPDVEALIKKELLPVRAHRKCPRKMHNIAPVSFLYRVA